MTNSLFLLFNLQANLMKAYQPHYGLPEFPLDLNTRESQATLREYVGFLIEESSEMFVSYFTRADKVIRNQPVSGEPTLREIADEGADVLHFMLEVMLFANVGSEDVLSKLLALGAEELETIDDTLFSFIDKTLAREGLEYNPLTIFPISPQEKGLLGSVVSTDSVQAIPILLWDLVNSLNLATSTLKLKPWKMKAGPVDENKLRESLAHSFIVLMAVFKLMGATPLNIYKAYVAKNDENFLRIKNKY